MVSAVKIKYPTLLMLQGYTLTVIYYSSSNNIIENLEWNILCTLYLLQCQTSMYSCIYQYSVKHRYAVV